MAGGLYPKQKSPVPYGLRSASTMGPSFARIKPEKYWNLLSPRWDDGLSFAYGDDRAAKFFPGHFRVD